MKEEQIILILEKKRDEFRESRDNLWELVKQHGLGSTHQDCMTFQIHFTLHKLLDDILTAIEDANKNN